MFIRLATAYDSLEPGNFISDDGSSYGTVEVVVPAISGFKIHSQPIPDLVCFDR